MKKFTLISFLALALLTPSMSNAQLTDMLKKLPGGLTGDNKQKEKPSDKADPASNDGLEMLEGLKNIGSSPKGDDEEIEIGRGIASTILGAAKLVPNNGLQRYVNLVGMHIAQHSERKNLPWTFGVVDTPSVNAFAAPGGYILVTSGLFALLETEDELAAALAHEIAHVNKKHHYNVIQKQKMVEFGSKFLGSALGEDDKTGIAKRLVSMGAELMARGLDKDAEYEADRDGVVLAARAGYDSSAMISLLSKLQVKGKAKENQAMKLLTATHPTVTDRIQALTNSLNEEIDSSAIPSPAAMRLETSTK